MSIEPGAIQVEEAYQRSDLFERCGALMKDWACLVQGGLTERAGGHACPFACCRGGCRDSRLGGREDGEPGVSAQSLDSRPASRLQ